MHGHRPPSPPPPPPMQHNTCAPTRATQSATYHHEVPEHIVRIAEDLAALLILRFRHLPPAGRRLPLEDEAEELESDQVHPQVGKDKLRSGWWVVSMGRPPACASVSENVRRNALLPFPHPEHTCKHTSHKVGQGDLPGSGLLPFFPTQIHTQINCLSGCAYFGAGSTISIYIVCLWQSVPHKDRFVTPSTQFNPVQPIHIRLSKKKDATYRTLPHNTNTHAHAPGKLFPEIVRGQGPCRNQCSTN